MQPSLDSFVKYKERVPGKNIRYSFFTSVGQNKCYGKHESISTYTFPIESIID